VGLLIEKLIHLKLGLKHPIAAVRHLIRKKLWLKKLGITKAEIEKLYRELYEGRLIEYVLKEMGGDSHIVRQVELYVICRFLKPEIVVETGVENGISSAFILAALNQNEKGSLYSIEILEQLPNGRRLGWLVPVNFHKKWNLIIGNSLEVLPELLETLHSIDLFIHDSEHSYKVMMKEYSLAWSYIKPGGLLLSDDTGRNEAFIDFCKRIKESPLWTEKGYGIIVKR